MKKLLAAAALVVTASLSAQELPPPFPRLNATKLLETDRVVVWNIVWPKGQPTALHRHPYDQVGTYYQRGGRVITNTDGTKRETMTEVGSLSTTRKGTTHVEEGNTDPPLQAVFIELKKDTASGLPPALGTVAGLFPRTGAKQVLDDERVTAWDFTASGRRTYTAARDTVVVFLGSGVIKTSPDGMTRIVDAGAMRYVPRGTIETEEVVSGSPRAIAFELK